MTDIVLFDGVCNLCNSTVNFILRWEKNPSLKFANLQSEFGKQHLKNNSLPIDKLDTFVLIEGEKSYIRSEAVIRLLSHLKFPWPLLKVFYSIPVFFRDAVYKWIAKNRYVWFGRSEHCLLPSKSNAGRFLS